VRCYPLPFTIWGAEIRLFICIALVADCIALISFVPSLPFNTRLGSGSDMLPPFSISRSKIGSFFCTMLVLAFIALTFLDWLRLGGWWHDIPSFSSSYIWELKMGSFVCTALVMDCNALIWFVRLLPPRFRRGGGKVDTCDHMVWSLSALRLNNKETWYNSLYDTLLNNFRSKTLCWVRGPKCSASETLKNWIFRLSFIEVQSSG